MPRVYLNNDNLLFLKEGDYGQTAEGKWLARPPNSHVVDIAQYKDVDEATLKEHEDGTITVSPSIGVPDGKGGETWHGHLIRGKFIASHSFERKQQ